LDTHVVISGVLALLWFTLPALISIYLLSNIGGVTEFLNGKGDAGILLAAAIFAVTAGLGLLPTYAQSIVVGWVFPFWIALAVAVVGYMGGAILGFGVSRLATGTSVRALIDRKPQWMVVRKALVEASAWRTVGIVALVRFPPNSPFAFTNLVLAASGVKWGPMLLGSLLGMLPRTAIAVFIASQAAATQSKSLGELVEKQGIWAVIAGLAVLVAAFVVLQQIGKRALAAAGLAPNGAANSKQVG
jgi:uncharacterized membrane protein YdjX (TVP38/TMEM64 family)